MKIQNGVRYQAIMIKIMIFFNFKIIIIKMILMILIVTNKNQILVIKQEVVIVIKVNIGNQYKNPISKINLID